MKLKVKETIDFIRQCTIENGTGPIKWEKIIERINERPELFEKAEKK